MNHRHSVVKFALALLVTLPSAARPEIPTTKPAALFQISINGKVGFMDAAGKTVIEPQFDLASDFEDDLAWFCIDHKFGYVGSTGKIVIPAQFGWARRFSDGLACVADGRNLGFIDKSGRWVIEPKFPGPGG